MSDFPPLQLPDINEIKQETQSSLSVQAVTQPLADPKLVAQAAEWTEQLLNVNADDFDEQRMRSTAVQQLGSKQSQATLHVNGMLENSISMLAKTEDGGTVAQGLIEVKNRCQDLDISDLQFDMNGFQRLLSMLPFMGNPFARFISRYQSAGSVITDITSSITNGQRELQNDNHILMSDKNEARQNTINLEKIIVIAQIVDAQLSDKLNNITDNSMKKFVQTELLFPLKQRIMDLQQQMLVNQQAVATFEILIRNNNELIRGVNRVITVTIPALKVAVTGAIGLARQRDVLKQTQEVNKFTANQLEHNARMLETQGAEIHKQASSTLLEMDQLRKAVSSLNNALEDIESYRINALPAMSANITELSSMLKESQGKIENMDRGNVSQTKLTFDLGE
ncbi:MAG: toxic anion resistance protein [Mariprofundales bacterium]